MNQRVSYTQSSIAEFMAADCSFLLGELTRAHGFELDMLQRNAWISQVEILQSVLDNRQIGHVLFEFVIPRVGKRADAIVVFPNAIAVIEFKIGSANFERSAIDQVFDYALDLKNFHEGSHTSPIAPILCASDAQDRERPPIRWGNDLVAEPILCGKGQLRDVLNQVASSPTGRLIDFEDWVGSRYKPTPTIIEAAQALFQQHGVEDLTRSDAGAKNLSATTSALEAVIETAKAKHTKAICFVTGVPGAGKTLAGLNVATRRAHDHSEEHAVFLSGNGPLVTVLGEALARDEVARTGVKKDDASRKVSSFIQNIHHFRDNYLEDPRPPIEHVVIFDEAQRAWTKEQASKFMKTKRGRADFEVSEPEFLVSVMDRHKDWCVVICLVGGGQEINTGEAGITEWLNALARSYRDWTVHVSGQLAHEDYVRPDRADLLSELGAEANDGLHLAVSMRSFRAEALSEFVGHVVNNRPAEARDAYERIRERYPIALTRDVSFARDWVKERARGSERFGLLASSGALRLRPEGIHIKAKIEPAAWFLNDRTDVRSSFYCEEVATEFDVQGLELDWVGVCWDADFRYEKGRWSSFDFRGSRWQNVRSPEAQSFLKNAYRVILTRARQGMVIFVPQGDVADPTRPPEYYDQTFRFLQLCGLSENLSTIAQSDETGITARRKMCG